MRIAQATGLSAATVSRILVRLRLNKVRMLEPAAPVVRYERQAPRDLLHIDIKKLLASSRLAIASPAIPAMKPAAPVGSSSSWPSTTTPGWPIRPSIRMIKPLQPSTSSIVPSTGSATSVSAHGACSLTTALLLSAAVRRRLPGHGHRASPHQTLPPTNQRKAERFIQTAIREWAYARRYESFCSRLAHLRPWTHQYTGIDRMPPSISSHPAAACDSMANNLLRHHI